jgi:hypothetical protein
MGDNEEYDPISDDELEGLIDEEGDTRRYEDKKEGVVDVDWSSLLDTDRQKTEQKAGVGKRRFTAARILGRIGVSVALAGEEFVRHIQTECQKQLDEEAEELKKAQDKIKEESEIKKDEEAEPKPEASEEALPATSPKPETTTTPAEKTEPVTSEESPKDAPTSADEGDAEQQAKLVVQAEVKQEEPTSSSPPAAVEPPPRFELLNPVAAFHATAVIRKRERDTLLSDLGPHRRALCARRDLFIRRRLCKLSDKLPDGSSGRYSHQNLDADLLKLSLQLYRRERTDSESRVQPPPQIVCQN